MRRGKWAVLVVAVCLVVIVAAVVYAAGKAKAVPVQEVVRAKRFELVDAEGRVRGALELVGVEPRLVLYDEKSRQRAKLLLGPDGSPTLVLRDEKGNLRVILGAGVLETIRTGAREKRPESSLLLNDSEGKVIWQAP